MIPTPFEFTLRRSRRAKHMRLTVRPGGTVVLTVPHAVHSAEIQGFFASRRAWIVRSITRMQRIRTLPVSGRRAYLRYKEDARVFVHERLIYWNKYYQYSYKRVAIKNTRRLWGSCSRKGNLNFSFALLFLPPELADYVIVHELCHIQEHNHGRDFWELVERMLPDYRVRRAELRRYSPAG